MSQGLFSQLHGRHTQQTCHKKVLCAQNASKRDCTFVTNVQSRYIQPKARPVTVRKPTELVLSWRCGVGDICDEPWC